MKKNSLTGVWSVFSFTLKQTLKSKSFIISYIIMVTLASISLPLFNLISPGKNVQGLDAINPVKKVYVNNESSLVDFDFNGLLTDEALAHIRFEKMQEGYDTVANRIQTDEQSSIILTISDNEGFFNLSFAKAGEGPVNDASLQQLGDAVTTQFYNMKIASMGLNEEQLQKLFAPVSSSVSVTDDLGQIIFEEDTSISSAEYWFIYAILFIILMVSVLSSSLIATSVVTEKSTRVIEYLLISIKPLALMLGKILAMLVAVLIQTGSMVVLVFISNTVTTSFLSETGESMIGKLLPENIFANLNIVNIIFCFLLMLLGVLFYGILASFAGATVSKLEEVQEGLTLFTLTCLVGAYLGIGAASALMASGESAYVTFTLLFPLSSSFILPGALLIGKASLLIVVLATLIQIITITLLVKLVSNVFEYLILHNGNTVKPKELLKLFATIKEGK